MLTDDRATFDLTLPALDARALARRVALPATLAATAVAVVLLTGGRVHAVADALQRVLRVSPGWAAAAIAFEGISLAGYVCLLSLVASRVTQRVGVRESAQITLAGAAATRLLPTAGAGGAALTLWTLRRAGLRPRAAARTLLVFFVLLYSVFLTAIVLSGAALSLGLAAGHGPSGLTLIPCVAALLAIALCLGLARRGGREVDDPPRGPRWHARLRTGAQLVGHAVHDALRLVRSADPRLAGAITYWMFDAAVLWAMLRAFGSPPVLPVVALAYLVGQVANTVPLPGTVSGGMAGVLLAFGVPLGLALPAVLAYRTIAVWLPSPPAVAAIPRLRATVARWATEDAAGTGAQIS